jgi:hypothetical protein
MCWFDLPDTPTIELVKLRSFVGMTSDVAAGTLNIAAPAANE